MIKVDNKDSVKAELEEGKETMEVRVKSMERQEVALREKYESMQESLNKAMGQKSE